VYSCVQGFALMLPNEPNQKALKKPRELQSTRFLAVVEQNGDLQLEDFLAAFLRLCVYRGGPRRYSAIEHSRTAPQGDNPIKPRLLHACPPGSLGADNEPPEPTLAPEARTNGRGIKARRGMSMTRIYVGDWSF
jgi:hypothetical protein